MEFSSIYSICSTCHRSKRYRIKWITSFSTKLMGKSRIRWYEIIEGVNTLGDGTAGAVRSSYPRAIGKFVNAALGDNTTFANGLLNDCSRSRRLIDALKTKFIEMGRNWLLTQDTLENIDNFSRTLYSHRFTEQRAKTNGRYGFIDLLED